MKTSTERSREHRKRLKEEGLSEIRGLYARDEGHDEIKRHIKSSSVYKRHTVKKENKDG